MKGSKKVWLTTFLATAFTVFGAGVAAVHSIDVSAGDTVTAESVSLVMDKGAGVRLGTAAENNGIRFVLTMDKEEYVALMGKVGSDAGDLYSEVSFGMIITKASYVSNEKELTVENLFDLDTTDGVDNTKFEWKPDGAADDWTVSDGKTLVVNQTFGYLGESEDYANDYVGFASLVSLHDYNLTQEFIGRGYMKYTLTDGTVNYRMADYYNETRDNNVRSMTYVAQKAAEDPEMAQHVETLNSLYINHATVQAEKVNVTVNHHKVDVHGEEIGVETETLTGKTIGSSVTATALTSEDWIYDTTKSTSSGVAYANNKTVLDLYYNQNPETAYGAYHVGGENPVEKTIKLDEVVKGGIKGEEVEVELALDLLEGTMPGIKVWLFVENLDAANAQITSPSSSYLPVADYYDAETGTYKFRVTFAWNSPSWDIGNVRIALQSGTYRLGIDVVSVKVLSDYDVKINRALTTTYTLPEAITGAVQYDKVKLTLSIDEVIGDMTELHIQLKNKAGTTIANNGNAYFTLADCATGEENTYAFELALPWANGDWNVTEIVLSQKTATMVAGVNLKAFEVIPKEYDVRINRARETTYTLPEAATGAVQYDKAIVTLELIELVGDLTKLHIQLKNKAGTTIANNGNAYFTLADCATGEANTYAFELSFPWANNDWDVTNMVLSVDSTAYVVGVNVKSIEIVPSVTYDFKIENALETTYTLPEAVTGAVRYDKAIVTLELVEIVGDLTQIHIQLLNASGATIANNSNNYFTLADCATGEANTYAFELSFPWAGGDWDITQIVLSEKTADFKVGVNVKSIEIVPVEYDLKFMANAAHEQQTYTLGSPIKATKGDKIEIVFTMATFYGTPNGTSTDIYFYLNDALGNLAVTPGWLELTDIKVDGTTSTYKAVANVSASVEIYSIKVQVKYAQKSGLNFDSITLDAVEYDFKLDKETTATYTLPETIGGMAKYGKADVTLQLVELTGDVTKVQIALLNAGDEVIADNGGEYYTLADYATGTANEYTFPMLSLVELTDYNIAAIRVTLDAATYVVGGYFVEAVTAAKDYDFVIDKATNYTYTVPEAVTGAVRYDTAIITVELDELVGDLTKLHLQIKNNAATVVSNNGNAYFTLADCATAEENVYSLAMTFPWANGNWDVTNIIFTVGDTAHVVGFNVKSIEIQEVAYQLEYSVASGSQAKVHTFDKVAGGVQNGYVKVTFDVAVFGGTLTNIQFNLCTDTAGKTTVANSNKAWAEDGTKITTSGGQISMSNLTGKKTVTIVTTFPWANGNWDLQSISLQLYGSNLQAGVSNIQVELVPDFTPAA